MEKEKKQMEQTNITLEAPMFVMKLFKEDEDIEDVEPSPGPLKILEVMTKRTLMVLLSPLGNDLINFVSTIEQVSMNVASEAMADAASEAMSQGLPQLIAPLLKILEAEIEVTEVSFLASGFLLKRNIMKQFFGTMGFRLKSRWI
jgi:hypothetical protein